MLELPSTPRRADLQAFSASLSLVTGLGVWAGAALAGAPSPAVWALATGAGMAGVLLGSAGAAIHAHAAWNRLARLVSRGMRLWISGVAFLVITVTGWAGSRLPWRVPAAGRSGWVEKPALAAGSFTGQGRDPVPGSRRGGWIRALAGWGGGDRAWVRGLLPFLVFLAWTDRGGVQAPTDRNYTLY